MDNINNIITFLSNGQKDENAVFFLTMTGIDIDERYRKNLHRIIDRDFKGNQSAFARRVGFEPSYINGILHGDRTLGKTNMEVICKELNLDPIEFMMTENTRIIADDEEAGVVARYRQFKMLGMSDMVKEAETSWIVAAKKKSASAAAEQHDRLHKNIDRVAQIHRKKKKESA